MRSRPSASWFCETYHPAWCSNLARDPDLTRLREQYESDGLNDFSSGVRYARALLAAGKVTEAEAVASDYIAGPKRASVAGALLEAELEINRGHFSKGLAKLRTVPMLEPLREWSSQMPPAIDRRLALAQVFGRGQVEAVEILEAYLPREQHWEADLDQLAEGAQYRHFGALFNACVAAGTVAPPQCSTLVGLFRNLAQRPSATFLSELNWLSDLVEALGAHDTAAVIKRVRVAPESDRPSISNLLAPFGAIATVLAAEQQQDDAKVIELPPGDVGPRSRLVFRGASLSHLREAKRALAARDVKKARALARTVVEAWGTVSDGPIPGLDELRALAKR